MRILVTGGTGQIGAQLAASLHAQGHGVRCLVRDPARLGALNASVAELCQGDVTHPQTLAAAVHGVEVVFHAAGVISYWRRRDAEVHRVNTEGTRQLLDAAAAAGVRRFILTSSIATLGYLQETSSGDENTAYNWSSARIAYFESKRAAEQLVLADQRMEGIAVNPGIVFGRGDVNGNSGRLLQQLHRGRSQPVPPGSTTVCNLDDVVAGHLLAWRHGRAGERYILGGTMLSFQELYQRIAQVMGKTLQTYALPRWVLLAMARLSELSAGRQREPALTLPLAQIVCRHRRYSCAKAESQLGYRPQPIEQGLAAAISWYREKGQLR